MLAFVGMKLRDAAVSEAAKLAVDYIPGMTVQEKRFAKDVINGISIAKTVYDLTYLINDSRQRNTYSYLFYH